MTITRTEKIEAQKWLYSLSSKERNNFVNEMLELQLNGWEMLILKYREYLRK